MNTLFGSPPQVTAETRLFWEGAASGRLLVEQCTACRRYAFPPRGICAACLSREIAPSEVPGPGVIYSFTVNHQPWGADFPVPTAFALVEFPTHPGVRVLGRVRDMDLEALEIGLEVAVGFEPGPGGYHVPIFRPAAGAAS